VGLIVMPTHGYGPFRRFILGSNTAKVLHDADCPVWTGVHLQDAPAETEMPFRRIVCAVDLGPHSANTLGWAAWFADEFRAELTVVHAVTAHAESQDDGGKNWQLAVREAASEELAKLLKAANTDANILLDAGDPARIICSVASRLEADVLVIGRGSAAGAFGRLRTNAYAIIRQSPCPVVSV
jgi:nucleotide-binding universal stress UspA family protein